MPWSDVHPTNAQFFRLAGAVWFNYTTAASNPTPNDIFFGTVPSGPPNTGDYFAIGWTYPFKSATLTMSTAFVGISGWIWQYWNGSAWTALDGVIDGTSGFTSLGARVVSWDLPEDWAPNTVNGVLAYHVRVLWSPWTMTTTAPRGSLIAIEGISEFILDTGGKVTPEDKGGPRVGVMGKAKVRRSGDGAIGMQLLRGDGELVESFDYSVRTVWFGPYLDGEEVLVGMGALDLYLPDFIERTYRMRIIADDGALSVTPGTAFIATEPYAPAGTA